jgi:acylphosphatase
MQRLKIAIRGAVQGVGFRPFVYRLAREKGLGGWVKNSPHGVFIEVEGPEQSLDGGEKQALILPDIATCRVCIQRK